MKPHILVVEDDQFFRQAITRALSDYGHLHEAGRTSSAKELVARVPLHCAFVDLGLGNGNGKEGLEVIKACREKDILTVVLTGSDDKEVIEEAYQAGCHHYYTKLEFLENFHEEVGPLIRSLSFDPHQNIFREKFITQNKSLKSQIKSLIEAPNWSQSGLLITGPTGVGKSLLANTLHDICFNRDNQAPFISVNLSELPENLIESELFGHKKGSFTGADNDKMGLLEKANGGTLFLDEIGTVPLSLQKKLLNVIETKSFFPIGGREKIKVNFTLMTATCDDLSQLIEEGSFRLDFYFRIRGREIEIPGLIERPEDITSLVDFFISKQLKKIALTPKAKEALQNYRWVGNIRELSRLISELSSLPKGHIHFEDLPWHIQNNKSPLQKKSTAKKGLLTEDIYQLILEEGLQNVTKQIEREALARTLSLNQGKINETTRKLQISKCLLYRIKNEIDSQDGMRQ